MNGPMWPVFSGVDFARGRLFDTSDLDEARQVCGRVFNPHELRLVGRGQRLRSRMDHLPLGGVSLSRLTWGARVAVDPDHLGHYYLLSVPVAGSACFHLGGQLFDVSPRCAAIVNAAQRFHFEADADFDQICVRFERRAVDAAWRGLTGAAPNEPVEFAPSLPLRGATWRALEPVLGLLARCARGEYPRQALPHVMARVEEMMLTTLLLHQAPALTVGEGGDGGGGGSHAQWPLATSPASLRRAQEHMREHLDEPLTLAAVARAGGVAVRTLQAAFHIHCGLGPMQWLREQRLHAVHEVLAAADDQRTRVTETALRFGFTHLGEFSRAYRARFGEAPRQTLKRRGESPGGALAGRQRGEGGEGGAEGGAGAALAARTVPLRVTPPKAPPASPPACAPARRARASASPCRRAGGAPACSRGCPRRRALRRRWR